MRHMTVGLVALLLTAGCATAPQSHDTVPSMPASGSVSWDIQTAFDRIPPVLRDAGWEVTEVNFRTGTISGARSVDGAPEWVGVTVLPRIEGGSDFRISVRSSRGGREGSVAARELRQLVEERAQTD